MSLLSTNDIVFGAGMWKRLFRQPLRFPHLLLPRPLTRNEKTTIDIDNFFNFCGSVTCLLLHFIILRGQKLSIYCYCFTYFA